ncbi:MAG: hypothetical protein PVG07_06310 [Acidobacteriota bacterium]
MRHYADGEAAPDALHCDSVGETLVLPELAAFRDREARAVGTSIFAFLDGDAPDVPFVTGSLVTATSSSSR